MSAPARFVVAVVGLYRRSLSPLMGRHCRFEPTCSAYAIEAVRKHGAARGVTLAVWRIARCHPWSPGGVDHVPAARHP